MCWGRESGSWLRPELVHRHHSHRSYVYGYMYNREIVIKVVTSGISSNRLKCPLRDCSSLVDAQAIVTLARSYLNNRSIHSAMRDDEIESQ
jgi:hypothetical protein